MSVAFKIIICRNKGDRVLIFILLPILLGFYGSEYNNFQLLKTRFIFYQDLVSILFPFGLRHILSHSFYYRFSVCADILLFLFISNVAWRIESEVLIFLLISSMPSFNWTQNTTHLLFDFRLFFICLFRPSFITWMIIISIFLLVWIFFTWNDIRFDCKPRDRKEKKCFFFFLFCFLFHNGFHKRSGRIYFPWSSFAYSLNLLLFR